MNYPLISEYIEAIKAAEDNFEVLKNLRPVLDEDREPVFSSGNFAVVFKMKDERSGKLHAVKCFLKEQEGRAEAYRQIAEELEYVSSTFLTPIKYLDKELFVDSSNSDETEFPVLLMDWVEGQTLDKYIREHINDEYELSLLAYQFSRLAMWLMPQPFAHGDLKPDNILVKDDGTLVLVDYDGMYVPAMKGQKARELGSPDFRHPSRTEDVFDEHIDDFSLASILLSLKAISLRPSLLEEYSASDRLLFSENDYRNLSESSALGALQQLMQDAELASLYSLYILALSQNNLSQVSFRLFNLSKPDKPQYEKENLSTEVTDEDLANAWIDEFGAKYSIDRKRLLYVPNIIKEYSIKLGTKVICDNAFNEPGSYNDSLEKVTIPNSVTHIGKHAFGACFSLNDINLPDIIRYIGDNAFTHCYKINITIPELVEYIGDGAFGNCRSLKICTIPKQVSYIGSGAFSNCYSLTELDIQSPINRIKENSFADCFNLKYVKLPNKLEVIENRAFFECYALEELIVPNDLTHIGDYAFEDCRSITHFDLPHTLKYLGEGAFECCESLNHVEIPDTIETIRKKVFCSCHSLSNVSIPNSVKVIEEYAFETCNLSQINLPDSVTTINAFAFSGCPIKQLTIPKSVKSISDEAFYQCTELKEVVFLDVLTFIGKKLFDTCTYLKTIYIPLGMKSRFELLLPEYKDKLVELLDTNKRDGWKVKDTRFFSHEEIAAVAKAEVVPSQYGNSVCFFMNGGGQTYIPLLSNSSLTVGDSVDLKTAKLVTLCHEGDDDIYRVME